MSTFEKLKNTFSVNWTTILVGWEGLGIISLLRLEDFPPLLTLEEVFEYVYESIAENHDKKEMDLILDFLPFEQKEPDRALVQHFLTQLSEWHHGNKAFELRKWRAIVLDDVLGQLQGGALYDLISLLEFWQEFGFPSDCPMVFQGIGNNIRPEEYYTDENLKKSIIANKNWLQKEMQELKQR